MAILGFRQRKFGPTEYYSAPGGIARGDYAVLQSSSGPVVAEAVSGPLHALPGTDESDLPAVLRAASAEDMAQYSANQELAERARAFCKERILQRKLDMKLVDVEIHCDRSKFIFYFTAPTRIDFRDLVKDLVREYRSRIELRQIGARQETQMIGAIGNCGQVCCCRRHLRKFAPVTIRMAKEQRLFLNPAKISGICGRLLCCLSYEQDNYEKFHRESPRPGKRYQTSKGLLKVVRVNMFTSMISVIDENNEEASFSLAEWESLKPWRSSHDPSESPGHADADMDDMDNIPDC